VPTQPVEIVGTYLSPYVRKVLVCLDLKGIDYRIDPIVPFFGNDQFTGISPVRRIPVLIDGSVTLSDSTVICEYLEERTPDPPLHPSTPPARARARWLEEFADTRIGEVIIWRLFNEIVIKRFVWGEKTDDSLVKNTLEIEIPQVLDYLESELPSGGGFFFGEIGVADIAVAAFFRNASFAGLTVDAGRWPNVAAFVARTLDHPSFYKLRQFEDLLLKVPIAHHREALATAGAPLTPGSFGTGSPRRGVLST
jgi:glutathione S-transferase